MVVAFVFFNAFQSRRSAKEWKLLVPPIDKFHAFKFQYSVLYNTSSLSYHFLS